jgi:glycosyltransferase involved in cell wall biosynthesis
MRILALSNFYPPYERGGEEISAQAIVNGLRGRGHTVEVITSGYGSNICQDGIYRDFDFEMDFEPLKTALRFFVKRKAIIRKDLKVCRKHFSRLNPEIVLMFSLWNIPREVAYEAEGYHKPVVYRLASYWPTLPSQYQYYWESTGRNAITKLIKKIIRPYAIAILAREQPPKLKLAHTVGISQAVLNEYQALGFPLNNARVIHNGIQIENFENPRSPWLKGQAPEPIKLLYVGRMAPEKGVHTVIEAYSFILKEFPNSVLTLAGSSWDPGYEQGLKDLSARLGVVEKVTFTGSVEPTQVPELMAGHHVLLVPSIWAEPFGRVLLEGMASGLVVIGTARGGMETVLKDEETGLVFPPEDAGKLVEQIRRILFEPALGQRLAQNGKSLVSSQFTEDMMVEKYEAFLQEIIAGDAMLRRG